MDRLDLGRRVMGLSASWADVVVEIAGSCARRVTSEALLDEPGMVGALSGTAPVVWVFGDVPGTQLLRVLGSAPEVAEVYVRASARALSRCLTEHGWHAGPRMMQVVHPGTPAASPRPLPAGYELAELSSDDLPEFRRTLANATGVPEEIVAAAYGDDFFARAAPAWLYGVRDPAGRVVGTIGVRRQVRAAMVFSLAVDAARRRRGVGGALLATAVRRGRTAGATFVHALAGAGGFRLATAAGFQPVGGWLHLTRAPYLDTPVRPAVRTGR